eukprot:106270-Pelagomonas_calceolata.AAC.1
MIIGTLRNTKSVYTFFEKPRKDSSLQPALHRVPAWRRLQQKAAARCGRGSARWGGIGRG